MSMDSNLQSRSPDKADKKPSCHKSYNDAANRKSRRHSSGGSASASSGSPRHGQTASPVKTSDDRHRRKDDGRHLDRDADLSQHGKGGDSLRDSGRQSHGSLHDYRHHGEHKRHRKYSTEGDRDYQRISSRSGRETIGSSHFNHTRHESEHDRSRDYCRQGDKYSQDKPEDVGYRSKDKDERENTDLDRALYGRRHTSLNMEDIKTGDWDRCDRDRGGGLDDKKRYRHSRDHKNDWTSSYEEHKGYEKYSSAGRDSGGSHVKETRWSNVKDLNGQKDVATKKRNLDDGESEKHKEQYNGELEGLVKNDYRHEQGKDSASHLNDDQESSPKKLKFSNSDSKSMTFGLDKKASSSSKQVQETVHKVNEERAHSSAGESEATNDLNAAKVAAMKAAELVNRNLIGSGYMSADQKKKLLWGNKKNTSNEESGHRWDLPLFSDQERQEKFNKLMGVKGDLKLEHKPENKDGSGLLQAEKQKELELDLEKHYTAGLRRRDGRTVGLGL